MKNSTLLQWALGLGLLYALYVFWTKQVPKALEPVTNVVADFYSWLTLPGVMQLLGNVQLPDGTLVPLQGVDIRQSPTGNVIAQFGGHYYQLAPSDADGNWPATLIQ